MINHLFNYYNYSICFVIISGRLMQTLYPACGRLLICHFEKRFAESILLKVMRDDGHGVLSDCGESAFTSGGEDRFAVQMGFDRAVPQRDDGIDVAFADADAALAPAVCVSGHPKGDAVTVNGLIHAFRGDDFQRQSAHNSLLFA